MILTNSRFDIFYLSADDEFIIKTVQHKEGEFLMKLLLGYYMVSQGKEKILGRAQNDQCADYRLLLGINRSYLALG